MAFVTPEQELLFAIVKSQAQNSMKEWLLHEHDSETLYDLRSHIEGLTEHPGWEILQDLITKRIENTQLLMETGLHLQAEYTGFIAEIRGMKVSRYAADAVVDAAESRAEQDRQFNAQIEAGTNG